MSSPAGKLPQVLASVWASSLPLGERRRLCRAAVGMELLGQGEPAPPVEEAGTALTQFEEVLSAAGGALGARPTVTELKDHLRRRNRSDLASRVGRLSKVRNGQAHPDADLTTHVVAALSAEWGAERGEGVVLHAQPNESSAAEAGSTGVGSHESEGESLAKETDLGAAARSPAMGHRGGEGGLRCSAARAAERAAAYQVAQPGAITIAGGCMRKGTMVVQLLEGVTVETEDEKAGDASLGGETDPPEVDEDEELPAMVAWYEQQSMAELRRICGRKSLSTRGSRGVLVDRLLASIAAVRMAAL